MVSFVHEGRQLLLSKSRTDFEGLLWDREGVFEGVGLRGWDLGVMDGVLVILLKGEMLGKAWVYLERSFMGGLRASGCLSGGTSAFELV